MINLDTRLLNKLNAYEIGVFTHILKRINSENKCFPSRELLQKESGLGREKLSSVINSLHKKGIISSYQEKSENGTFGKTIYTIETNLAGVYVNSKGQKLEENRTTETRITVREKRLNRATKNRCTETPRTEKQPLSINHPLSISHFEVLPTLSTPVAKESKTQSQKVSKTYSTDDVLDLFNKQFGTPFKNTPQFHSNILTIKENYPIDVIKEVLKEIYNSKETTPPKSNPRYVFTFSFFQSVAITIQQNQKSGGW